MHQVSIRFPFISIGIFLAIGAVTVGATILSSQHCAMFQCNGWVASISDALTLWIMLSLVMLPVSLIVALWRLVRWLRRPR